MNLSVGRQTRHWTIASMEGYTWMFGALLTNMPRLSKCGRGTIIADSRSGDRRIVTSFAALSFFFF